MSANRPRAAIIGAGVIGQGWAARFLLHGWDVTIADPVADPHNSEPAWLNNAHAALEALYDAPLPNPGRLRYSASPAEAVAHAQWVQESVPESLSVKRTLYKQIADALPADTPLASSTSGFKPSDLAAALHCAERMLVCHPFNPVYLLPAVEVVGGAQTTEAVLTHAESVLTSIGMRPLRVRREIDAHIADRLLEAVWREALWLVRDDIATTEEIDEVIRNSFGLRWAQMGLFETYRIAGGEAGMQHFLQQFGPALQWPWSKLTDVPELDEELINKITQQSDAQSSAYSIPALERQRDENLVAIIRALKSTDSGAGAWITRFERRLIG